MSEESKTGTSTFEIWVLRVISVMIIGVVFLAGWMTWLRIERIRDQNAFDQALISQVRPAIESTASAPDADLNERAEAILAAAEAAQIEAQQLTASAEDAQNTVDLLLSFLEGAAVLVGIALGAAAYFGFRNFREIRDEMLNERDKNLAIQSNLGKQLSELETVWSRLETALVESNQKSAQIDDALAQIGKFRGEMENAQEIFSQLVLAHQEMRLSNYTEAYKAAQSILDFDSDNVQALYLAGWLENQYIPDGREQALSHLEEAVRLSPDWPSARAALGVVQRRRALQSTGKEQDTLLKEAIYNLSRALLDNPRLLDPNLESFNGPLAGIYREAGEFGEAQKAYERACDVTPGSSYPAGNLAALYLRDHKVNGAPLQRAIAKFIDTCRLAKAELAQTPSDYFIMMDIAMSTIILSGYNAEKYPPTEGDYFFNEALVIDPTNELRSVTRRGLQNLIDYCPDEEDWREVKEHLDQWLAML